jgi:hypothetical protein
MTNFSGDRIFFQINGLLILQLSWKVLANKKNPYTERQRFFLFSSVKAPFCLYQTVADPIFFEQFFLAFDIHIISAK